MSCADVNDAMSALYTMVSQLRTAGMENGRTDVGILKEQQDKAIADMRDAIARRAAAEADSGGGLFSSIARFFEDTVGDLTSGKFDKAIEDAAKDAEAAWNSPAFWNDLEQGLLIVAKVGAAVGAAAATVVTVGAAGGTLVAVALLMSAGGMAVSETGCLDGLMGQGWSANVGLAMELGGTAMTMGATFASTTAGGLKVVGQLGAVASVTGGVASAGAGAAHVHVGDFQADAQSASADEVADTQSSTRLSQLIEDVIEAMKNGDQTAERQVESIAGCEQTNEQTEAMAVLGRVR
jgi:hypothetical protein